MRIAYLFNSSTPSSNPSSIQVVNTCAAISKLSHDIKLIVPNTGLKLSLSKFYGIKKTPKLIKLKYFKKFPLGINYYLFSVFAVFYGLLNNTDLFITRNFFTLFLLNFLKKKVIIEVHHDLSSESRVIKFLYRNFEIFNKKNVIKIVAITNSVKNYLVKDFKVEKKKIDIIPSASSLKFKFSKLKKKKRYKIGYFGSLDESKGSKFIMNLSKKDKINDYFIYGGSPKEAMIMNKKNSSKRLKIYPNISYSKIGLHISKMDILLMPSNTKIIRSLGGAGNIAKYTSPLKLFDYLASGKLIMVSNVKVFKEILKDGNNCLIIKNFNPNSWINKINKIKFDLININRIKKNAFKLSKKYTYLIRAQKILNF